MFMIHVKFVFVKTFLRISESRQGTERELVKDKPISNVENEFAKMKILIFENNKKLSLFCVC